jgi:hypothetical protein
MEMADVTVHINEAIDHDRRTQLADTIRAHKGVMAVAHHDEKSHLMIIEYDPDTVTSLELLQVTLDQGLHAQLIGM